MTEFPIAMGDMVPAAEQPADQYASPFINLENAVIDIDGKRYGIRELLMRLVREAEEGADRKRT